MSVRSRRAQSDCFHCSATPLTVFLLRKSVLCILSDASVRKYVPVRHEHKGNNIEQVIRYKNRFSVSETNKNLTDCSLLGHSGKPLPKTFPGLESPRDPGIGVAMRLLGQSGKIIVQTAPGLESPRDPGI